ncbi:MAG: urea ABC transporter permease subunit UrtC, partial [Arcobacter sp.]|nr:urea ABC transporter permease subunit UrtC [Arcobacter sp.]
ALPEVWLYALGGLFVLVTLYLPKGIVGLMETMNLKMKKA